MTCDQLGFAKIRGMQGGDGTAQQAMAQQPIVGAALWAAIQAARRDLPAKMRLIAAFVIDSPTDFHPHDRA